MEINGMVFTQIDDDMYLVEDLSYICQVGIIVLDEGPGWILTPILTKFLDYGQLATIAEFMKGLPKP